MTEKNTPENQPEGKKKLPSSAGVRINYVPDGEDIKEAAFTKKAAFKKQAQGGGIWGTGSDTMRLPLTYIDPLFDPVLVLFPKENIRELNRRLRHYYNYHPVVGTVIDTHVEFSLCDFELSCSDPSIEKEYNDLKERTSLHELLMQLGRDYFLVGECHLPGTKVTMADGTKKNIEDVRAGDEVITHDGTVKKVMCPTMKYVKEEVYGLKIMGQGVSWMTGNHPVLVIKKNDVPCSKYASIGRVCVKEKSCVVHAKNQRDRRYVYPCKKYKEDVPLRYAPASELVPGDFVVIPKPKFPDSENVDLNFARLLGYYLSEGCTPNNGRVISLANSSRTILKDMFRVLCATKTSQFEPRIHRQSSYNTFLCELTDPDLAKKLILCGGKYSQTKRLHPSVLRWSNEALRELVKAFILGDGWIDSSIGEIYLSTTSEDLANQLFLILVKLGCKPILKKVDLTKSNERALKNGFFNREEYVANCARYIYWVGISKSDTVQFADIDKLSNLKGAEKRCNRRHWKGDYLCVPIVEIKKKYYEGPVYSLEVEDNHSYLADNFAVHNSYGYGDWDDIDLTWKSFVQYPPENIEVFKTYVGPGIVYALKPDEELRRVLSSSKAADRAIAQLIPDDLKESILKGKPYILNNNNLIVLSRKPAAYVARGSSLVTRVLKYLLLEEKLLLLLFTYIDTSTFPIKLVKVGDAGKGIIPSKKQIEEIRTLLMQAMSDPSFTVVTHPFVNIDFPTPVGKFENPINLLEFVYKRILVGLMASDEFLKGSVSPYASATVSTRLVMMRYLAFRKRVENVVLNKIFRPVAVARGYRDKEGGLILPTFKWKQRNLLNEQAERELLMRLRDKQEIPFKLLCEVFNFDYDQVKKDLENEQSTVFDTIYKEAIREKSKDKGIINEVIKGVPVPKAVEKGVEEGERVTKPGRPSILEELKAPPYVPTPTGKTAIPPRAEPLEKGTETKPVGIEKPETKPGPAPEAKPEAGPSPKPGAE